MGSGPLCALSCLGQGPRVPVPSAPPPRQAGLPASSAGQGQVADLPRPRPTCRPRPDGILPTHVKRLRSAAATSAHLPLSPCPLRPRPLPRPENSRRPRGCSRSTPDHAWVLPEFLQETNESRIPPPSPPPRFRSNRTPKEAFLGTFTAWRSSHHFVGSRVFEFGGAVCASTAL